MCEKQGYIERYYVESPKDRVDLTIADMQRYTRTLIEEETNLPVMVEKALREIDKEDKDNAANTESEIVDDIEISLDDLEQTLKDKDFEDFEDFLDEEAAADADYLSGGGQ
jgi:paraquat-inducible protein B